MPEHPHLERLHRAVAEAGAHERDELERLAGLSLPERVAAGVSWPPLQVEDTAWAGRDHTAVVLRAPRGPDLHEGITAGDRVELTIDDARAVGIVRECAPRWAEIRVRGQVPEHGVARVTRLYDPLPWIRLADALARADAHRSPLRDVLLGERRPSPALAHGAPFDDPTVNESQRRAAQIALSAAEVALIHGPPGTGKTRLLAALLVRLVADGDRPWALADSNAAVDHLAAAAADRGLDVVRVGAYGRMNERGRALSLRNRIQAGPYGTALIALERDLARCGQRTDRDSREAGRRLFRELRELRETAQHQALQSAQVIATTFGTLAYMAPELPDAHTAVVDEATQATEPAIWTAVPRIQRLVLCGDPHQLGPVVRQPQSPLERSLLARLLDPTDPAAGAIPLPMLDVQHRMHTAIQALVRDVYGDGYTAHATVGAHLLRDLPGVADTALTGAPTLWIDTAGASFDERRDPATRSLENAGEASAIALLIGELREAGVARHDIAVIAPYSAQVRRLRELPELEGIQVDSVNAFQGREREVILISWVRCNPDGDLGFVADERRLVVALTRARRLLVQVGDTATLGGHPAFAAVLDQLAEQGALRSIWEEPWVALT